ncbi:MAG TPA: oxidoreductase [Ruminococcaceae bacterium]|jgi:predicted dehydrogenase|nr:oxidoreductase [Oscillospiraceae bacterium]
MRKNDGAITFSVIGLGGRGSVYLNALEEDFKGSYALAAIAEPDKLKQAWAKERFGLSEDLIFDTDKEFLARERLSDVAIVSTQDKLHKDEVIKLLDKGYDIILEKPISTRLDEVMEIYGYARQYPHQVVVVCHVLRYTPFFNTIKRIIDSKELGNVVTIAHNENIGYYHFAHSYVRGPWNNALTSAPLAVTKSCHDFDILLYILGDKRANRIASFGGLSYFCKKNFDEGKMADYCMDCSIEQSCAYSALKIYSGKKIKSVVFDLSSVDKVRENLGSSRYGRCVFNCDNNVVDHQSTIIEFDDGITATFSLSAFTSKVNRTLKITCERGEIRAAEKPYVVEVSNFLTGETRALDLNIPGGGHGGGDKGFIMEFMRAYQKGEEPVSTLPQSIESHVMAFLAEKSRNAGGIPQSVSGFLAQYND